MWWAWRHPERQVCVGVSLDVCPATRRTGLRSGASGRGRALSLETCFPVWLGQHLRHVCLSVCAQ